MFDLNYSSIEPLTDWKYFSTLESLRTDPPFSKLLSVLGWEQRYPIVYIAPSIIFKNKANPIMAIKKNVMKNFLTYDAMRSSL